MGRTLLLCLLCHTTGTEKGNFVVHHHEELEQTAYRIDLPPADATVLCISRFTLGVGSNSCGPPPSGPFVVGSEPADFDYELSLPGD